MAVSINISIKQNSQSIANNTSSVTASVIAKWTNGSYNHNSQPGYLSIDGTKYTFTSGFNDSSTSSGSQTLFSKTVTISHNSNGSKTVSCSASYTSGISSGTVTASASKALTTIARKSTLSASKGELGISQTLNISSQSDNFTHTLKYTCGSKSDTIETKTNKTAINWTPPLDLANQNTTGTSVSVKLTLITYSGNTNIGNVTKTITCNIPASVKPICTLKVEDFYANKYNEFGGYIKGKSKLKVTVSGTEKYESPIASYSTKIGSTTYTSSSFTTNLNTSGEIGISATVKDKRGRSSNTVSTSINVLDYSPPVATISARRCDDNGTLNAQGEYCKASYKTSITSLNGKNSVTTAILKYKLSTADDIDSNWESVNLTTTEGDFIFLAKTDKTYNIRLILADKVGTTIIKNTAISTAFTLMHFLSDGFGMAIGKISELSNYFEVGINSLFHNNIRVKNMIFTGDRTTINETDYNKKGTVITDYGAIHLSRIDGNNPYIVLQKNTTDTTEWGGQMSYDGTNMTFNKPIAAPNIGTYKSANSSSTNISSSTSCTNKQSFTLEAGVWIVQFWATWGGNSSGRRHINIANTAGSSSTTGSVAVIGYPGGTGTYPQSKTVILNVSSSTTFYINAGQNSGSTLSCETGYRAVRIK